MAKRTRMQKRRSSGAFATALAPYLWLLAFFVVPGLIVLRISLSQTAIAQPPYTPLFDFAAGWVGLRQFLSELSFSNYAALAADSLYIASYLKSLQVAAISTAILLIIGYPIAYGMSRTSTRVQAILVMAVILPFWTSFLIRVYAWMTILQHDGLLNRVLVALHIIDAPVTWLATDTAVYIGLVYSYLPFMILPLYATLQKIDQSLIEAAADLGCRRWKIFFAITLPLSLPGIAAGVLLCFIPIVGEFVIPDLLGGSQTMMIGQTLWTEFFSNRDWPIASAIAMILLCLLVVPIAVFERLRMRASAEV
ncbi:MAG: ABC transporter permease subunit [Xanthobacteraceae bacterium]